MLPFKNRLTRRKDFEKIQKSGQFFSEANVAIKIAKNGLLETRIGFIAGMKFAKKAVERNQAKRLLRDLFQKNLPQIKKGVDVIVMIRKREGEKIRPDKLSANITQVLQKSGLIETKE
jgi:ribonuclease P protein component